MKNNINIRMLLLSALLLGEAFGSGCKKFVTSNTPITSINSQNAYTSDQTAIAVLTGIYDEMSNITLTAGGIPSISLFAGLSADELTLYPGSANATMVRYYQNSLSTSSPLTVDYWSIFYPVIFVANSALDGLSSSNALTPSIKQQLTGEAKFIRAFCYFYLVNLYGDVPLVLGTNYKSNSSLARTPKSDVWNQIVADLTDAQNLLSATYLDASLLKTNPERVRPSKWSATAMLARTYLYLGNWASAEAQATALISNTALFGMSGIDTTFLKASLGNKEAIWQLQPVKTGQNTPDAMTFILPASGPNALGTYPVYLSNVLLSSFTPGDARRRRWVDSVKVGTSLYYYPYKYKVSTLNAPLTEFEMVLRLGEQYLIRAEAKAESGDTTALSDLNVIRIRAGLVRYTNPNKDSILTEILHERQLELFTEWGHRWLDLIRTGNVNNVMSTVTSLKGGQWQSTNSLYPIPLTDLQGDQELVQNPGY